MRLWKKWIRRLFRLLFALNPAACWILFLEGRQVAFTYLHHLWTLYIWRKTLSLRVTVPLLLPEEPVYVLFPDLDLTRVELFYPLPRPGGVKVEELVILCALVRHLKPKRLLEIGTAEGRTTLNLALHAPPEAEIITIDLPPEAPPAKPESGPDYRQMNIEAGILFRNHPLSAKIRLVLADSTQFDWMPYERSVDFVFIDGAHDYESVRKDTENALRIIRPGGIILWHDYGVVQGVTVCLNEFAQRFPIHLISGTSLVCLQMR